MKYSRFFVFVLVIGTVFFHAGVMPVYAGEAVDKLLGIVDKVANLTGTLFLSVAVGFFIGAGFFYWKAGGDPKGIEKAHQNLLWAVIGTAVGLLAYVVPTMICTFLEVTCS